MGATLIINPGSSSKKFALFKAGDLVSIWHFEQTGEGFSVCEEQPGRQGRCEDISATVYQNAIERVLEEAKARSFIAEWSDIERVGIRIVAPSTYFTEHRVIDAAFVDHLSELTPFAAHHIPNTIAEITRMQETLPEATLVGVSDSAFHATADPTMQTVSIPREDAERFDVARFGYHGISVSSVVKHLAVREAGLPERVIVCHVGSGVSITAVKEGQSRANSMGYTPVSGIMMSSRMGDVPADVLAALMVRKGLKKDNVFAYLYDEGGFRGLTGVKDLRLVFDRAEKGEVDARSALDLFAREVKSHIAAYAMLMDGVDTIVLTATAAVRNPAVRSLLVGHLPLFHTYVHNERNEALLNSEGYIHTDDSQVKILVLKTDELGEMHRVTQGF